MNHHSPLKEDRAVKVAKHTKESGHWYDRDGNLIEQVMKADKSGYTRTTLYHARKLDLVPGVTTIIKCADAPALNRWKEDQAILSALTLPRHDSETEQEWLIRVRQDMQESARNAAEEGTRIHAAIESAFSGQSYSATYRPHVEGVRSLIDSTCGGQLSEWLPEKAVVSLHGYATKADLHSDHWLIDFKGKDGDQDELDRLSVYDSHWMQLAATRAAIGNENLRCAIVYVSRTHPGACSIVEVPENNLRRGLAMFRALLTYWQAKNAHCPSWATEAHR